PGYQLQVAVTERKRAAEPHLDALIRPRDFPGIRAPQPIVRLLLLPAVTDALPEDPVFIAQAIADRRQSERRHGVEIARGEPAEAAVPEPRIRLLLQQADPVQILAVRAEPRHP